MDIFLRDLGLVPDSEKVQTAVIQKAIDDCASSGGGTVYMPSGLFVSGTLYMRSNVFLHLESNTTLKASPDYADYNAADAWVQNWASEPEHTTGGHFIVFLEVEHAGLTGHGTIDGNGMSFPYRRNVPDWMAVHNDKSIKRPAQMVYLCESKDIRIRDVRLFNSSYWSCFVWGCENVIISGLYIRNNPEIPNSDGIDIDSSRHVIVSDCLIDTEDDCITFRCAGRRLKNRNAILEDVTVTNCQLRTPGCNAFRIGVGNGIIRNCLVSNVLIRGSSKGVCLEARYTFNSDEEPGTAIENISFNNIFMESRCGIYMGSYCMGATDCIAPPVRNIRFSNITAKSCVNFVIQSNLGAVVEDIVLQNFNVELSGTPRVRFSRGYHEWEHATGRGAFLIAGAKNVTMRDITVRIPDESYATEAVVISDEDGEIFMDNVKGYKGNRVLPLSTAFNAQEIEEGKQRPNY